MFIIYCYVIVVFFRMFIVLSKCICVKIFSSIAIVLCTKFSFVVYKVFNIIIDMVIQIFSVNVVMPKNMADTFQIKYQPYFLVPGAGLEPAQPQWLQDFKSCVSTSSTT